jgi:hypothetical protein
MRGPWRGRGEALRETNTEPTVRQRQEYYLAIILFFIKID